MADVGITPLDKFIEADAESEGREIEEEDDFANFDPDLDNMRMEDGEDAKYKSKIELEDFKNDLLFDIQGVGEYKKMGD